MGTGGPSALRTTTPPHVAAALWDAVAYYAKRVRCLLPALRL